MSKEKKKTKAMCFPGYQTIKQKAGTIMNSDATLPHDGLHWVQSAKWNFKVIENVKYRGEGKKRGERSKVLCSKTLPSNSCTHMVASPRPRSPFSWYIHSHSSISVVTDRRLFVHCQMAHAMCQTILFFFQTQLKQTWVHPRGILPQLHFCSDIYSVSTVLETIKELTWKHTLFFN